MRKASPGIRFFDCEECDTTWREDSRDCRSPSGDFCEKCDAFSHPVMYEEKPEWSLDRDGKLVKPNAQ